MKPQPNRTKKSRRTIQVVLLSASLIWQAALLSSVHRHESHFQASSSVDSLLFDLRQQWRVNVDNKQTSSLPAPFAFSACLLVKDDNKLLPEWLAYHYTMLPLRRLIIGVDPFNSSSVDFIVDAYREIGMDITIWADTNSLIEDEREKLVNVTATDSWEVRRPAHRVRQAWLLTQCLRHLRKENRTWTMLIDSDEYLSLNRYKPDEGEPFDCANMKGPARRECTSKFHADMQAGLLPRSKLPPVGAPNSTVAHFIAQETGTGSVFDEFPCVPLPRALFGPHPSTPGEMAAQVPEGFDPTILRTLRDRHHEKWQTAYPGKSIVDASRYNGVRVKNVHRISLNQCSGGGSPYARFYQAFLRVQHYTGTWEEFKPIGVETWHDKETFDRRTSWKSAGADDDSRGWLAEFVNQVGKDKAYELTIALRQRAVEDERRARVKFSAEQASNASAIAKA